MTPPERMRAVVLTGQGGLDKLEYKEDWPVPTLAAGEALIRVGACGCNNTDINTRTGWYSKTVRDGTTAEGGEKGFDDALEDAGTWGRGELAFPRIQGADVAGEVVAVGDGGSADLVGKRVMIDPWLRDWNDPLNFDKCRYYGSERDGGYAEFTTAPLKNVHAIDSALSDVELGSFATSYITAENLLFPRHRVAIGRPERGPGRPERGPGRLGR